MWLTGGLIKLFLILLKISPAFSYYHNELSCLSQVLTAAAVRAFTLAQRGMECTSCRWKATGSIWGKQLLLQAANQILISASNQWIWQRFWLFAVSLYLKSSGWEDLPVTVYRWENITWLKPATTMTNTICQSGAAVWMFYPSVRDFCLNEVQKADVCQCEFT